MSAYCKHGRKAWKCRLCNTAKAASYTTTRPKHQLSITTDALVDLPMLSDKMLGQIGVPPDLLSRKPSTHPQLDHFSKGILNEEMAVSGHVLFETGPITTKCPIPKSLLHNRAEGLPYRFHHILQTNNGRLYKVNFSNETRSFVQAISFKTITEYRKRKSAHDARSEMPPHIRKETRDSEYLLSLMTACLHKTISMDEGTSIINEFLKECYPCKSLVLNDAPQVSPNRERLVFPTTRGLRYFQQSKFERWLLNRRIKSCGPPQISPFEGKITPGPWISVDSITITDNCTLNIGKETFHVREEGSELFLVDSNHKQVRQIRA